MAISRLVWKPDFHTNLGYARFVCDSVDDIPNLPTTSYKGYGLDGEYTEISPGSAAHVIDERKLYVLDNNDEWIMQINYAESGGGGGGGGFDLIDDGFGNVSIV